MFTEETQDIFHEKFHKKLISEGDTTKNKYIFDGIIDFREWKKIKTRILFILKEPNTNDEYWSLTDVYKGMVKGDPNSYGEMMAKITYIFNSSKKFADSNEKDWLPYLKAAATINLKKTPGGGETDWQELYDFAKKYSNELREQITQIEPHIIFCAGYNEQQGSICNILEDIILERPKISLIKKPSKEVTLSKFDDYYVFDGYHFAVPYNRRFFEGTLEGCEICKPLILN